MIFQIFLSLRVLSTRKLFARAHKIAHAQKAPGLPPFGFVKKEVSLMRKPILI
jgi:hypothetical protein